MSEYEESRNRHPSRTGRIYFVGPPMQLTPRLPAWFDPDQTERVLRESYKPILSEEDYAKLRERCGLGPLIEGECKDG